MDLMWLLKFKSVSKVTPWFLTWPLCLQDRLLRPVILNFFVLQKPEPLFCCYWSEGTFLTSICLFVGCIVPVCLLYNFLTQKGMFECHLHACAMRHYKTATLWILGTDTDELTGPSINPCGPTHERDFFASWYKILSILKVGFKSVQNCEKKLPVDFIYSTFSIELTFHKLFKTLQCGRSCTSWAFVCCVFRLAGPHGLKTFSTVSK